ncbi:DUF1749-domain-containing protein [Penicillium chermesinum]|uniref:DUF1749-domain-containing protein n=1 Tax=Penicillium chermesinum TaxID=63820 RepID=A0A9W9TF67_9EURO|nr:DUF1749-domain-containing protein [Penicillium chermesinum]KAJ5220431.1 DUF1749-domain-containing protein [Penicillium chermesinum]KAJ6157870.1 DUF1749-domain-containing protein [Penicillium chermesinum]
MYSKFWPKGGLPGILHHYTETLVTFEYTTAAAKKPHSLVFIGGLGDGLATTSYMADLAKALLPTQWSLFILNTTSSYQSWGLGHLDRDTNEIAQCIRYIKDYKTENFGDGKIVLMGHSTGSQCVLHYLYRPNPFTSRSAFDSSLEHVDRLPLDGAIMQAPVSDREAIQLCIQHGFGSKSPGEMRSICDQMEAISREAVKTQGIYDTLLPLELTSAIYPSNTPISCRRFLSLYSPDSPQTPSEEDLFSADLSDEQLSKTFGMIQQQGLLRYRLMVLYSGADQAVPAAVNKETNLSRWKDATDHSGKFKIWDEDHTAIIPNASHALSNDDQAKPREFLVERVLGYLQSAASI